MSLEIGDSAFFYSGLEEIAIPQNVKVFGQDREHIFYPGTHWNHPKKGCFSSRIQKKVGRYVPFSLFCISLSS